jgi:hypothetical protein
MRKNSILILLVILVMAVSATIWWPMIPEPNLGLPLWVPLLVITLVCGLAIVLSVGRWLWFALAAPIATFAGTLTGFIVWPMEDGISQSYTLFAAIAMTIVVAILSLAVGLVCRKVAAVNEPLRVALWLVLAACIAVGPVAAAVRPAVIAHRDTLAAERFTALKVAIERTRKESGNTASVCDGQALKRNYAGPPFQESDWHFIAGHYVQQGGYAFGIWVNCSQPDHYTVDVFPVRAKADGTRRFCSDESGAVGCMMQWVPLKGNVCNACPK